MQIKKAPPPRTSRAGEPDLQCPRPPAGGYCNSHGHQSAGSPGRCSTRKGIVQNWLATFPSAARSEIRAALKTSRMARCAFTQTGCAGHHAFLAQAIPDVRHTFRRIGPSMASITSSIDAFLPGGEISNPPNGPRREEISSARVSACSTFERKLSGAPVASASDSSDTRVSGGSAAK